MGHPKSGARLFRVTRYRALLRPLRRQEIADGERQSRVHRRCRRSAWPRVVGGWQVTGDKLSCRRSSLTEPLGPPIGIEVCTLPWGSWPQAARMRPRSATPLHCGQGQAQCAPSCNIGSHKESLRKVGCCQPHPGPAAFFVSLHNFARKSKPALLPESPKLRGGLGLLLCRRVSWGAGTARRL